MAEAKPGCAGGKPSDGGRRAARGWVEAREAAGDWRAGAGRAAVPE